MNEREHPQQDIYHVVEAFPALEALKQAKEALLCTAPAVDKRSPAYREIEKALELIKELGI